jgi:hypothetical protein
VHLPSAPFPFRAMMGSVLDVVAKALNSRSRRDGGSLARMYEIGQITEGPPQRADAPGDPAAVTAWRPPRLTSSMHLTDGCNIHDPD